MHHIIALLAALAEPLSSPTELDVLQVTASRRASTVLDASAPISVVDRGRLAETPAALTPDYLRDTPGVFVQQTTPGQAQPIVRGLKGSQILHLVDGARLNNAIFRSSPTQYFALVDPFFIDRIEVLRGPASSLYGSDAMGGVVQVFTPRPVFDQSRSRLIATGATAERFVAGAAEYNVGDEQQALRVSASAQRYGDRRTGDGESLPTAYEAYSANMAYRARVGAGEFSLTSQFLRQPETPRVDELIPGFGQTEPSSAEFFFAPNERDFVQLRSDVPLLGHELRASLSWQRIIDDRRTRAFGTDTTIIEDNRSNLLGFDLQAQGSVASLFYTVGVDFYYDRVSSMREQRDSTAATAERLAPRFPDGSTSQTLGVFLEGEYLFEHFSINGGVRWSTIEVNPGAQVLDFQDTSGHVGVVIPLAAEINLVANYGTAFRAPNVFDLGALGARPGNRFNIANPELDPETLRSADLGIKWGGSRTRGEAFVWAARYDEKIESVLIGEQTEDGRDIVRSENIAEVELYGVEGRWGYQLVPSGNIEVTLSYVFGEEQSQGTTVPADRIPPLSGRLSYRHELAQSWMIEPFLRYASGQDRLSPRDERDPRIDPDGTDGYVTANLAAHYRPHDSLSVTTSLENLTDRAYRDHGSGLDAPGINFNMRVQWVF